MALNEKTQKVMNILLKVFTALVVAVTVFVMVFTVVTVALFDKNDRAVFGYKFFIVQSDSMSLSENNADLDVHFNAGDLVIVTDKFEVNELKAGDIITFVSQNEDSYGETVTHMIKEVVRSSSGALIGFKTYGTNTGAEDSVLVEPEFIIGQYNSQIKGVGHVMAFMKSVPGYIVCVLTPFLLLIGNQAINVIRLYRRYKAEQNAEMDEKKLELEREKSALEAQRLESERMLKELEALKAQLAAAAAQTPVAVEGSNASAEETNSSAEENNGGSGEA